MPWKPEQLPGQEHISVGDVFLLSHVDVLPGALSYICHIMWWQMVFWVITICLLLSLSCWKVFHCFVASCHLHYQSWEVIFQLMSSVIWERTLSLPPLQVMIRRSWASLFMAFSCLLADSVLQQAFCHQSPMHSLSHLFWLLQRVRNLSTLHFCSIAVAGEMMLTETGCLIAWVPGSRMLQLYYPFKFTSLDHFALD